ANCHGATVPVRPGGCGRPGPSGRARRRAGSVGSVREERAGSQRGRLVASRLHTTPGGTMYLITGGAGFIGSHLVRELIRYQQDVRVLDNFSSGRKENLEDIAHHVDTVEGDVRELSTLRKAMRGVRYVLHQAAIPSVLRSVEDPASTNEVNAQGTLNVLVAAREAG